MRTPDWLLAWSIRQQDTYGPFWYLRRRLVLGTILGAGLLWAVVKIFLDWLGVGPN